MKKLLALLSALVLFCSASVLAFAEVNDFSGFTDDALTAFYQYVKQEMERRGLLGERPSYDLPEGKYIIGQDIQPGNYTLTCIATDGQSYGNAYASLGGLFGGLDSDGTDYGSLFSSLGGMMSDLVDTTVEVLGDYGTVLKSASLKKDQSIQITLEIGTALQITSGSCTLVPAN